MQHLHISKEHIKMIIIINFLNKKSLFILYYLMSINFLLNLLSEYLHETHEKLHYDVKVNFL